MKGRLSLLALGACFAFPAAAGAAPSSKISPAEALGRALAPRTKALEACGVRWKATTGTQAVVRFRLAFDGTVRGLSVGGVRKQTQACLTKQFNSLRLPKRLSYIVRNITLPLSIAH